MIHALQDTMLISYCSKKNRYQHSKGCSPFGTNCVHCSLADRKEVSSTHALRTKRVKIMFAVVIFLRLNRGRTREYWEYYQFLVNTVNSLLLSPKYYDVAYLSLPKTE
jgi:hypothetical protein